MDTTNHRRSENYEDRGRPRRVINVDWRYRLDDMAGPTVPVRRPRRRPNNGNVFGENQANVGKSIKMFLELGRK